jgi:hypothetical protein
MNALRFLPFELFVPETSVKSVETQRDGPAEVACSLNHPFGCIGCGRERGTFPDPFIVHSPSALLMMGSSEDPLRYLHAATPAGRTGGATPTQDGLFRARVRPREHA